MLNSIHLTPIMVIFTIFAVFAWTRVFLAFRKQNFNIKELIFWTIIWLSAILIVYIPGKSDILANFLGIGRGFDAMVFIGVVILFYIVYRLYVKSNENEEIITKLIRKIALSKINSQKHKKRKRVKK